MSLSDQAPYAEPLLIETSALCRLLGVSRDTVFKRRAAGLLPRPVPMGRKLLWRRAEIIAWVDAGCPSLEEWERRKKRD